MDTDETKGLAEWIVRVQMDTDWHLGEEDEGALSSHQETEKPDYQKVVSLIRELNVKTPSTS